MRMIADGYVLNSSSMGAPGVDEVRWLKPLRPGTRIRVRATVLDKRVSNSRPERGFVRFKVEVIDEQNQVLSDMTYSQLLLLRNPGMAA